MNKTISKGLNLVKVHNALEIEINKKKEELMQSNDLDERNQICDELKTLISLAQEETNLRETKKVKINWKDITSPIISLTSILLILNFERDDIITSKSFTLATRLFGR